MDSAKAGWLAVTAACLALLAGVFFMVALVAEGPSSVVVALGFTSLSLVFSSLTFYRARKRP
jgi:predicted transporter